MASRFLYKAVLEMGNEDSKIIPGHGPLSGVKELKAYREMLIGVRGEVMKLIQAGQSREEVVAAKPTKAFDEKWGGGFMQPDVFTGLVFDGLKK